VATRQRSDPHVQANAKAHLIAIVEAGLAALNAPPEAEPVKAEEKAAEGPFKTKMVGNAHFRVECGLYTHLVIYATADSFQSFGSDVSNELVKGHAREIAAELNRLHASKTGA
jgi:hypothetical protein